MVSTKRCEWEAHRRIWCRGRLIGRTNVTNGRTKDASQRPWYGDRIDDPDSVNEVEGGRGGSEDFVAISPTFNAKTLCETFDDKVPNSLLGAALGERIQNYSSQSSMGEEPETKVPKLFCKWNTSSPYFHASATATFSEDIQDCAFLVDCIRVPRTHEQLAVTRIDTTKMEAITRWRESGDAVFIISRRE